MAEKTIAGVRARYDSPTGFLHKDSEVGLLFAEIDRLQAEREVTLAGIADVRRYCELTLDSCRVQAREVAEDILQLLDSAAV